MKPFCKSPPPLAKLAAFLLLAVLAGPSTAQLVIPATTGADACTQGGLSEIRANQIRHNSGSPSTNAMQVVLPEITSGNAQTWIDQQVLNFRAAVMENGGRSALIGDKALGTASLGSPIASATFTAGRLKKNTRYVVVVYTTDFSRNASNPYIRTCFKTRGSFTNAEQRLTPAGDLPTRGSGGYGCFAVAATSQDIRECLCWGTRGGSRFNTATATRQALGCGDSS